MRTRPTVLYFSQDERPVPELFSGWIAGKQFEVRRFEERGALQTNVMRSPPMLVLVDGKAAEEGMALCRNLKADAFTAIAPVAVLANDRANDAVGQWFDAGADEVLSDRFSAEEQRCRLDGLLLRTERSVSVHPSTRLPGTTEIERAIRTRIDADVRFAVCYADLDHFKEYNDRYSYRDGDRIIFLLSRILSDVAKGIVPDGFVGHIGGDDFIMVLPIESVQKICGDIVALFDTLIGFQYNEQDRRAGYFFGRDRRGQLYRVPLMTLSIGIVTNEHRRFGHPARASELATEMKSYAKTLPGSVFVVDRRHDRNASSGGTPTPTES